MPHPTCPPLAAILVALALVLGATAADAILDVEDRGPQLNAGRFALRVTNVGVVGNPFFESGRSYDPSLEFPLGSGNELLKTLDLWVGGIGDDGETRVSGGPQLEWRPSLDPDDRVRAALHGYPGTRLLVDDDGDGRMDEERLDGRDDDGDGGVDEDLAVSAQQMLAADFRDDRPEAVNYGYGNGETHAPLGLAVHMDAMAWAAPAFAGSVGLQFRVRNVGLQALRNVYIGVLADLDSKSRSDPTGHLDDVVTRTSVRFMESRGTSVVRDLNNVPFGTPCFADIERPLLIVEDGAVGSTLPVVGIVPLSHTTDPLELFKVQNVDARAVPLRYPGTQSFRVQAFEFGVPSGQGGVPALDHERYAALAGTFPTSATLRPADYRVLVSCGPFAVVGPGEELEFAVALVCGQHPDSVSTEASKLLGVHDGLRVNLLPDSTGTGSRRWNVGETGLNGHEVCLESPPGYSFIADPHCPVKLAAVSPTAAPVTEDTRVLYENGRCVWTDADCDMCTGAHGEETIVRWLDPGSVPPAPPQRMRAGDHAVTIEWADLPEQMMAARTAGTEGFEFFGYRLYRVSDWRRFSILPPPSSWSLLKEFGRDTLDGQVPLEDITDESVASDGVVFGLPTHPIGRYRYVDAQALNGFDYVYLVTTVAEHRTDAGGGLTRVVRLESPLAVTIDDLVTPRESARADAGGVWVVPNPYRARADWDRPPVPGDTFTRHLDFMGLPEGRSRIRIWTVAGDLVAELDHDASTAAGQASWDLISRNGQEVESGIYLFTVDSQAGHARGRFVVVR